MLVANSAVLLLNPAFFACSRKVHSPFPFFPFVGRFQIGEYIPKDQGGKFVQMELLNTEDDETIVRKIREGLLEQSYGDPVALRELEKTELEKSVWLERLYFLPSFARLYYLNKDEEALDFMLRFFRRWVEENPRHGENDLRYNWYDMQVAWRAIHLSWCYFLCEKGLDDDDRRLFLNSLEEHGDALLEGFGDQPLNEFNHQSHGALAMLYIGVLFPAFEHAGILKEKALRILDHHLEYAFYPDGGNIEQMFGYYPFETHLFRDACLLCRHNSVELSGNYVPMLQKMADFLTFIAQPDGTMPPVNDSYPMPVGPTLQSLKELSPGPTIKTRKSHYFEDSQIGVICVEGDDSSWYLLANPAKRIGTHAHAGRLSFVLWFNSQAVLVDSACCNYDNPLLVKWYRTSRAHNTVLIDGKSDRETSSDSLWAPKRMTGNHISDWIEKDSFLFCRMVSPSGEEVNQGVHWNRSLAIVKNKYLIIHDCFQSEDQHCFESLFHFPPVKVEKIGVEGISFEGEEKLRFLVANPDLPEELTIEEGLVSVEGRGVKAPMAGFRFRGSGVLHFVLVCVPGSAALPGLLQRDVAGGCALRIVPQDGDELTVLMRNPQVPEISAFGKRSSQLFEVI